MKVSLVGTGYVGLVTGACLAEMGNIVTCMDTDRRKIDALRGNVVDIHESGLAPLVTANVAAERLRFTDDLGETAEGAEVIFISVGTPRGADGSANTGEVYSVASSLKPALSGKAVVLAIKSTVPIGTGEAVQAMLGEGGSQGTSVSVASVPEFLREGSAVQDFNNPDRIVIGTSSDTARKTLTDLFAPLQAPFVYTSSRAAEMVKLAANSYLAMRVSFANAVQGLCDALQVDSKEVIAGLSMDRRIGHRYFQPGLGYGGPCLPKDVDAMVAAAGRVGIDLTLMKAVRRANDQVLDRFVERVLKAFEGDVQGVPVCALGLSFKAGTGDLRGSRAIEVLRQLEARGAKINSFDPAVSAGEASGVPGTVASSPYEAARGARVALMLTAWPDFAKLDFRRLASVMAEPLWINSQNSLDGRLIKDAGFRLA